MSNTIFSYSSEIGEWSNTNIFDFLPGYISNWLVAQGDGTLKLRQALFEMEIEQVLK